MALPDPARVNTAATRFTAFFHELNRNFVEREDLLVQVSLALLAREHVLMTGPPGTAKSQISSAVLRRILDEKTGEPSLYARQFTESTVQTDLVGPIDFKTLMETGRTEHFTDEGLLGAVHAFLDEVFDGRDMLLRSALNVLQERELKQGTKTTRGRIECAVMTTNRYLAEVLENARETLLAFVDRIAFVAFMPRAFADPANLATVLRRHVGGASRPMLDASLTVQDLDALQATVDAVHVSDAACDAIATFLEALETELSAASRADPTFIPTRYVSTRTAVRCGRVLRAIVVFDRLFRDAGRPLEVQQHDFKWLRLHLLLSGPSPEAAEKLLARETDPRERRQLTILRTEREAFERCLTKVPHIPTTPRAAAPALASAEKAANEALSSDDASRIVASVQQLAPLAQGGGASGDRAAALMRQMVDSVTSKALRSGLTIGGRPDHGRLEQIGTELSDLADKVETTPGASRDVARWLRGRGIALLDDAAAFGVGGNATDAAALMPGSKQSETVAERVERRLLQIESFANLRRKLDAAGAELDAARSREAWRRAISQLEEELALMLDAIFRDRMTKVLGSVSRDRIGDLLVALSVDLADLDRLAARVTAIGPDPSRLKERVAGPRISALIAALFESLDATDRNALVRQIHTLLEVLSNNGLKLAIAPSQWLVWSAAALVRADRGEPKEVEGDTEFARYRSLRAAEQRTPISLTLREIAIRVAPEITLGDDPNKAEADMVSMLAAVPDDLRADAVRRDLARVERAIARLERWFQKLQPTAPGESLPAELATSALDDILKSKFLVVIRDDAALLRFALETRVIAESFPTHAADADALRARIEGLQERVRKLVADLARTAGDLEWSKLFETKVFARA